MVQHRTPPRVPRRLHPRSRREAPLRSQTHPTKSGVIQHNQSPDSPGRLIRTPRDGSGYAWTPGIHNLEQVAGWRKVTDAVHTAGGVIFNQLWHVGRVSHTSLQPDAGAPVAPSAITADAVKVFVETGPGAGALAPPSPPRALTTGEVKDVVQLYADAARNALDAGFDGVEIHSANGYLVNQFMSTHTNHRNDEYGGSLQNRLRFLREVVEAVAGVVGKDRLGVRFSPLFTTTGEDRVYLGLVEDDPHETYIEAVKILEEVGIAYVSLAEADWDNAPEMPESFRVAVRENFSGTILLAGKYTAERAVRAIEAGWADLIAFGRPFIANPDLPERIANDWPLNTPDPSTMYGGTEKGYTDYPTYRS
ncbi:alkene reductase [Mycobacterium avium subsp. hominissuis]|uniref:alkene reductase n=3 Tax=Mycobacterium avium TaxID=1764 RepID=UPI003368D121